MFQCEIDQASTSLEGHRPHAPNTGAVAFRKFAVGKMRAYSPASIAKKAFVCPMIKTSAVDSPSITNWLDATTTPVEGNNSPPSTALVVTLIGSPGCHCARGSTRLMDIRLFFVSHMMTSAPPSLCSKPAATRYSEVGNGLHSAQMASDAANPSVSEQASRRLSMTEILWPLDRHHLPKPQ